MSKARPEQNCGGIHQIQILVSDPEKSFLGKELLPPLPPLLPAEITQSPIATGSAGEPQNLP